MSPNSDEHDSGQVTESGGNLKIIDLEFETLRQFREVMAPRLSYEGFFVATPDPLPKGTPARFRFLLPDGFTLVEGTAVVTWSRFEDRGPDERAGMALLFNELEHQSREIVDELIDFHIATGGDPFDIGPPPGEPGDIGTDALEGDTFGERRPASEAATEPTVDSPASEKPAAAGRKSDDFLPDWLSEVAQKHEVDLTGDVTVPVDGVLEAPEPLSAPELAQQEFEISLMPDDEVPDETPVHADVGTEAEVVVSASEVRRPPRDLRLWPFVVGAVVVVAVSAIVWWIVSRGPVEVVQEPVAEFEETAPIDRVPEVVEKPTEAPEIAITPQEVSDAKPEEPEPRVDIAPAPATRVLLVAAARVADATVVTVRANGDLAEEAVRISRLDDPPRVWVRIQGIETFYRPNDIEVATPEVARIRVGHHPEETPQSLYVVLDLASTAAAQREYSIEGDTLRVVVKR